MRARSFRLVVPAVLSMIVIGGSISAVEVSCSSRVARPDDAMLANADAVADGRDVVADAADVDARDAIEVDAAVDAAPPDTPT